MNRIVLAYSHEPSGHSEAARALESALLERGAGEPRRFDVSSDAHPLLGPVVARAYLELVQRAPEVWESLYDSERLAAATKELREFAQLLGGLRLTTRMKALAPGAVACTHALPLGGLSVAKRRGLIDVPLAAVLTDFAAHPYWVHPEVDLYLAPTEDAAAQLVRRGASADRVRVTGIPVHPSFSRLPAKEDARRTLGLSGPVVLVAGGTKGLGPVSEIVEELCRSAVPADILVSCGTNEELYVRLARRRASGRVRPLRFHAETPVLLAAADILVGKAGGVSLAEAMAAGVPMALFEPIPGQERRNASFVLEKGAAQEAEDLESLGRIVRSLLAEPSRLAVLARKARAAGRPDAARAAAEALQGLLQSSGRRPPAAASV